MKGGALGARRLRPATLLREGALYLLLAVVGAFMAMPFVWSLITSVKPDAEIFSQPIRWWPSRFTLEHYSAAFSLVPFGRYLLNSLVIAVGGVLLNLFFGSLAGYAFARLRFPGSRVLFAVKVASMMVPGIITMIPSFLIIRHFPLAGGNTLLGVGGYGLLNSYLAVLLPGAAGAFAVFLMRQFFVSLPGELAEAARLDGCSEFGIFWRVYLPLARPPLATLGIFTFQAGWNAFLWPIIVFNDPDMSTVQMGLQAFSYNKTTDYGALMAASIVTTLPMLILFIAAQRYFVNSLAYSGGK